MQKTILVTGGAGYVGSVLVRALLNKGYKVRVLDKLIFTEASLKGIEDKIELVKEDIQNVDPSVMDNVAAVYHLAGFSSEPVVRCSPRYANLVNHMAVERIAKMAKEKGVERFIFASSCSVYFTFETSLTPSLINENDPINPISAYAISKRAAEEGILDLSDHKFHPIIFRKGTIFGFSQKMRYDLVLNAFTRDAFLGKKLTVNSGGQVWRPLLDIQDAVWAYIQALEMPLEKVSGKIFNVCNKNWTTGELAEEFQRIIKEEKGIDVGIDIKPFEVTRNYKADNSLFRETFKFIPCRTLKDAILEIWNHLEKHPEDATNPIYDNGKWEVQIVAANMPRKKEP